MALRAAHDLQHAQDAWLLDCATAATHRFPLGAPEMHRELNRLVLERLDRGASAVPEGITQWISSGRAGPLWVGPRAGLFGPEMDPSPWRVPELVTTAALADHLNLGLSELEWYADTKSWERSSTDLDLRHYTYYWLRKNRGGYRLVEAPKQNLKYLQRKLLRTIIDRIPPHDAAHGFRRGRSIHTYAGPHTGRDVVLRFDLENFFSHVSAGQVWGIFRTAGYPSSVAHLLAGLTTNAVPHDVLRSKPVDSALLRSPHLPQGAPTSPALANLAAYRLDLRLRALARRFEANYTRYADDIAVSGNGEFVDESHRFTFLAQEIIRDEGFRLRQAKTTRRRSHQRQVLTGMVVNRHLNIHRADYDQLRAVLHDARQNGPAVANRHGYPQFRSHLEGRIGFVQATNPARARKLWAAFDAIVWD